MFLSHTAELREFPRGRSFVAEAAVSEAGGRDHGYGVFPARDSQAAEYSRTRVRGCDVYVGLIGLRYGAPVRDELEVSYCRAPSVRLCRREHVAEAHAYALNGILTRDIESHHRGLHHQDASADREVTKPRARSLVRTPALGTTGRGPDRRVRRTSCSGAATVTGPKSR